MTDAKQIVSIAEIINLFEELEAEEEKEKLEKAVEKGDKFINFGSFDKKQSKKYGIS